MGQLTNPLQLFSVAMTQQILEDGKQVGYDVEPIGKQTDSLVHFQVAPDSLVDGFELGLDPKDLGCVEDGAVEVDVDAEGEELADLHVDFRPRKSYLASEGELVGYFLACFNSQSKGLFEEGSLDQRGNASPGR